MRVQKALFGILGEICVYIICYMGEKEDFSRGLKEVDQRLGVEIERVSQMGKAAWFIVSLLYGVGFLYTSCVCSLPVYECFDAWSHSTLTRH